MRVLKHLWNRATSRIHLIRGIRLYRSGRLARAASLLQKSLVLGGPSFHAHLYLGWIYLRLSRFERARQEFAHARFLDAGQFAVRAMPEDLLLEMAERFYRPVVRRDREEEPGRTPVARAPRSSREREPMVADDFTTAAERERFRILPPIRPEDVENVDWTDLARFLGD